MTSIARTRIVPLAGVVWLALVSSIGGCRLFNEQRTGAAGPMYPVALPRGGSADVQVFRDVTVLRLTNSTAQSFGPGRVWLNQQYSSPVDAIAPGQTVVLDLRIFVDEFGELFSAGGFFAQREPTGVALVEIETGEGDGRRLVSFIVVENKYD